MPYRLVLLALLLPTALPAATITVTNSEGKPLPLAMVTRSVPGSDRALELGAVVAPLPAPRHHLARDVGVVARRRVDAVAGERRHGGAGV